ncbi:hypothetical protein BH18VER1_BH18VER1_02090 [soil metagenome]
MFSSHLPRLRLSFLALVFAASFTCLAGCGNSQKAQIAGKWKVTNDTTGIVWEFAGDGSVMSGDIRGRYSFGSQRQMKLQTPFATFVYKVEIDGDQMTWNGPNGVRTELSRVKE